MADSAAITQTVVLAAGNGSRLGGSSGGIPKPLVTVGGIPLIGRALSHARSSGCTEAVVVVGHEGSRVKAAVEGLACGLRVRFVEIDDPSAPNGVSLSAAAPHADRCFFLQMVDHVFDRPTLARLIASPLEDNEAGRVLVDRAPDYVDLSDATRVRLAKGRVGAIGKGIEPWDAIDAGCFVLTRAIFDALAGVPAREARTVSSGMRRLVALGALGAVDLEGVPWVDVDTPLDREAAERLLLAAPR